MPTLVRAVFLLHSCSRLLLQTEVGTASEMTASELETSCIDSESDAMR